MIDFGNEVAFGRAEGVIGGEVDVEEEDPARIGTVLGTDDGGLPMELVLLLRTCRTVGE